MAAQKRLTSFFSSSLEEKSTASSAEEEVGQTLSQNEPSTRAEAVSTRKKPRMFSDKWLDLYSWLRWDDKLCGMTCHACCHTGQSNPFTTGCINFRTSILTRHENSKSHLNALQQLQLQSHFKTAVSNVHNEQEKIFTSDKQTKRHIVQLRTVYVMAQKGIPANDFSCLMELQAANGCENADTFYSKPEIISEMEIAIFRHIEEGLINDINNSPFIGVMLDETCDITVEKKLVIYVRYLKEGKVLVVFLGNKHITDSKADGIKAALCKILTEKNIIRNEDYSRLMGLGTDGAAVMTGCKNGVGVKLKALNNKMIQVHCIAHRLNLAASQASNQIQYMEEYRRYIQILYRFYQDSEVRYTKLRDLQQLLHARIQQVPEGTTVRWLSVESAVKMIYQNYDAIVMSLEDDKDKTGKAKGLWNFFATSLFVLASALLIDILTVIGILSLTFQKDLVNLASIRHNVDSTISAIDDMRNGSHSVDQALGDLGAVPAVREKTNYKGVQILDNNNLRERFNHVRSRFIDNMLDNMRTRFPHDELDLLESFDCIFNPKRYPDHANLNNYAVDQLDRLCDHYMDIIDTNRCKGQFLQFKHLVTSYKAVLNFEGFVELLIKDYSEVYPDLSQLASVAMVIPVSGAPCERGFSHQNVLKNKLRNRLNPEMLNRLMMIRLAGPDQRERDFLSVARAFGQMKARLK